MNALIIVLIAVLNSLWQAVLLGALVWIALRLASQINAATRFVIWWAVLGVVLILPVAPDLISAARESLKPVPIQSAKPLYAGVQTAPQWFELTPLVTVERQSERWPVWVASAWGLIFLYRLIQIVRSYLYLRGLKRRARISSEPLPTTRRAAHLLLSPEIDSPIAVGFARPAVILPEMLEAELSPEEMDHVLQHEAAHLARWDDWSNLAGRLLGAVLALHPVAVWILYRIESEREAACDDWVVGRTGKARNYAASLARMYELRWTGRSRRNQDALASGIFGRNSRIVQRIELLVSGGRDFSARVSARRVAVSVAALIAIGAVASLSPIWIAFAQSPLPAFDVASIKRHTTESIGGTFAEREGGRLTVENNGIFNVIDNAYGISRYQLIGAPEWVNSERYDIEARGTATAGQKEIMLMLQTLLADRFAMKSHFETREMPAYILTVAKGGPKLRLLGSENCVSFDGTKPNPEAVPNVCGNNLVSRNNEWRATHISLPGVVRVLSSILGSPVIDQTGIKGTFDLSLQWTDDLALADKPDNASPSIYTALRETIGLELKSGRGPVEVLVIDHIERPTSN